MDRTLRSIYAIIFIIIGGTIMNGCTNNGKPAWSGRMCGIVEGFYGTPWTTTDRASIIRFLGERKANLYIYAPKDDPYHREKWREDYPPESATALKELVGKAEASGVTFCLAMSPGKDVIYSSSTELAVLLKKLRSFHSMGITCFGLFLDDIQPRLIHQADINTYGADGLAPAQADFLNRLHTGLLETDMNIKLLFCPTEYSAKKPSPYLTALGNGLDPDIMVLWTGTDVLTPVFTEEHLSMVNKALKRKVFIWDNYPVNDYFPQTLFMGPIRGRTTKIWEHISGYVSNPMNEAETSKISLHTIFDFLSSPSEYDPETALHDALKDVIGRTGREPMEKFCSLFTHSFLTGKTADGIPDWASDLDSLPSELRSVIAGIRTTSNPRMTEELTPYLDKMSLYADAIGLVNSLKKEAREADYLALADCYQGILTNHKFILYHLNAVIRKTLSKAPGAIKERFPDISSSVRFLRGNVPENIMDGNQTSLFVSSRPMEPGDSLLIDLKATRMVREITVVTGGTGEYNMMSGNSVETSIDGISFNNIGTLSGNRSTVIKTGVEMRYLRITETANRNWHSAINEISFR